MSDAAPATPDPSPFPASPPGSSAAPTKPLLERLPWYTVPLVLLAVPALFAVGAAVAPHTVYDHIVWPYYWGPIKADAENFQSLVLCADGTETNGFCNDGSIGIETHAGYNVVNTASWAVLLGLCILGAAQVLQRTKVSMGPKLIVGAAGWVVAGSIFHVMEDVALFHPPLDYFFITPPIYLLFAAFGVGSLLVGHYLRGVAQKANLELALQKLFFIVAIPIVLYLLAWLQPWEQVTHWINPVWVTVFGLVPYLLVCRQWRRKGAIDPADLVGWMSVGWILLGLAYVASFLKAPWFPQSNHPVTAALLAPFLAAGVAALCFTFGLLTIGRFEQKGWHKARDYAKALLQPINLLLIASQMLDGFATAIGIDTGGYNEKHVLSAGVIDWTRQIGTSQHLSWLANYPTFFGFVPVKLVVSLLVVYAIDVSSNTKEGEAPQPRNTTLTGLVKFAIIMVGLGPGIRDFLRMSLGV